MLLDDLFDLNIHAMKICVDEVPVNVDHRLDVVVAHRRKFVATREACNTSKHLDRLSDGLEAGLGGGSTHRVSIQRLNRCSRSSWSKRNILQLLQ